MARRMRLRPSAGGRRLDVADSREPRRTRGLFEVAAPVVANYRPRRPQDTVLHRLVRTHLDDFLRHVRENYDKPLPRYVVDEFLEYLRCGDPVHGFVRAVCPSCGHVLLVPFSCKRRGICPSCAGRRMNNEAAQLVDRVLPGVPLRQWVLSLPWDLRRLAAFRADAVRVVARAFADAIFAHFGRRFRGVGRCGAVTFVQRAGGSLNLNVHLHVLALDGVFRRRGEAVMFRRAGPPTPEELAAVVDDVRRRVTRWLRRQGLLDDGEASEGPSGPLQWAALEGCAAAAARQGVFEHLDVDGRGTPAGTDETRFAARKGGRWSAECDGFNLHAGVTVDAGDDDSREKLCRYAARPAFALGRLVELADGRIGYRVRWSNSPSGPFRVMEPLELLARLAAIVPPPRYPLVRYHGVLAPASRWRPLVVPRPRVTARCCAAAARVASRAAGRGEAEQAGGPSPPPQQQQLEGHGVVAGLQFRLPSPGCGDETYGNVITVRHWNRLMDGALLARGPRVDWATLLRRTFGVDALACPVCTGRLRVLELVTDPAKTQALLEGLGLEATAQPKSRRSVRAGQAQPRAP